MSRQIFYWAKMIGLILVCLICGYGFYRMNNRDTINAAAFTFGILGIILSVMREKPKTDSPQVSQ